MFRFRRLVISLSVLILAVLAPWVSRAQVNDGGIRSETGNPVRDALERRSREIALRSVALMGSEKRDPRAQRALLEQLNDDFKQIQLIRLNMVKDITDGKPFEFKRLADDAAEIKKRATRLRSLLVLLEDGDINKEDPKKVEYQKDTIQDAASDLCLEISRFTSNPLFKPGAVYNLRYAIEANNTLDTVINVSANIRDSADRLWRNE